MSATHEPAVMAEVAGVLNRKALAMPRPKYPLTARRAGVRGVVTVRVVVDVATGQVVWARIVSGPDVLREAVLDVVCGVRFSPIKDVDGRVGGTLVYRFGVREAPPPN